MEKDRETRYQSAAEMLVDLRQLQEPSGSAVVAVSSAPPKRRLWMALGFVVFIAVIAVWLIPT